MKIYYYNDESETITVQVNGQLRPSTSNPFGEPTIKYFKLKPNEGRVFEIDAPIDSIPFVKKWNTPIVLLSYLLSKDLECPMSHHDVEDV